MNSIAESAQIPVALCVKDAWKSGSYWGTPGHREGTPLHLEPGATWRLNAVCRELTAA